MAINIKNVAKWYAELPGQNRGLDLLQIELSKIGLTADSCPWVIEFRKNPEAPIAPKGKSIAATESIRTGYTGIIDWNNPNCFVSQYFTVAEVTQGDRRRIPAKGSAQEQRILKFAKELDKVRIAWGHPIGVTSWNRPEPINSQVGGVQGSEHTQGSAADVYTLVGNPREFEQWLDKVAWVNKALGYGVRSGKGFTHLGSRPGRIRWDY